MDYTRQPLFFKLKKVARYLQLYGPARTRAKVLGQLHMKRSFTILPARERNYRNEQRIAIIGCGNYAFSNIAYYLQREFGTVIAACMDVDINRAASLSGHYRIPFYTDDAAEIIADPHIEMVYIASNHATHAEYAIEALRHGKHVYIEKPHVVTEDQLARLIHAMSESTGRVFLGFNRAGSRFGRIILDALDKEPGAGMYNWFVAGHAIEPEHWYFRPEEGGRVLGNLCHWTDFALHMGRFALPVRIQVTRGSKPDTDIVVVYTFPDETIVVITFSAKGHTFEGVREHLSAHRGNCLIAMEDYHRLSVHVLDRRDNYLNVFRDHGHRRNIVEAYRSVLEKTPYDKSANERYVANTAWLFLKTREALERNEAVTVDEYPLMQVVG